jgi:hypothetical protein
MQKENSHETARFDCVRKFAEIRGDISRLQNGKAEAAQCIEKLTIAVEKMKESHRRDHDESVRQLSGYQNHVLSMTGAATERVAVLETKTTAFHKRIDNVNKLLTGLYVSVALMAIGIFAKVIFDL